MDTENRGQRLNWQRACQVLGCSKTQFYRLVNKGRLAAYRVGQRGLWVYEADCRELVMSLHENEEDGDA